MNIDDNELEQIIIAAYIRGATWIRENPAPDDEPYLAKAARDYADKTMTIRKIQGK